MPISPVDEGLAGPPSQKPASPTMAIVSLVLGCVSLPLLLCAGFLAAPISIGAVVCGHIALSALRSNPAGSGKGMALGGLVTGYVGILISLLFVVFLVVVVSNAP